MTITNKDSLLLLTSKDNLLLLLCMLSAVVSSTGISASRTDIDEPAASRLKGGVLMEFNE